MTKIDIPEPLQKYTNGKSSLSISAAQLCELPKCIQEQNPELYRVLFNSQGKLCGYANMYLKGSLISNQLTQPIELSDDDEITIIAAVSGG